MGGTGKEEDTSKSQDPDDTDVHAKNITGKLMRHSRKGTQLKKPGDSCKSDPTNYSTNRFQYRNRANHGSYVPV